MKKGFTVELMTELAIFAALGFILAYFQGSICRLFPFWPNGGSVGIAMCAVFIVSYRHGLWGMVAGLIIGLLDMMTGLWISPLADAWYKVFFQLFLDYFGAWMVVGLAGCFSSLIKKSESKKVMLIWVVVAAVCGGLLKYLMHFAAGMLFWPAEDVKSQFVYSLGYNGSYMIPSIILCAIVMAAVIGFHPEFIKEKNE